MEYKEGNLGDIDTYSNDDLNELYQSLKKNELDIEMIRKKFYYTMIKDSKSLDDIVQNYSENDIKKTEKKYQNMIDSFNYNPSFKNYYEDNSFNYFINNKGKNHSKKLNYKGYNYRNKLYLKFSEKDIIEKTEDYSKFIEKLYQNLFENEVIDKGKITHHFFNSPTRSYCKNKDVMIFYFNSENKNHFQEFNDIYNELTNDVELNPKVKFREIGRDVETSYNNLMSIWMSNKYISEEENINSKEDFRDFFKKTINKYREVILNKKWV